MNSASQLQQVDSHLKTLRIFHFVFGGIVLLCLLFLVFHYWMMNSMLSSMPAEAADGSETPDFAEIMDVMLWGYVGGGLVIILVGIANLLSAIYLGKKKNKTFSLVIAGLNCLSVPLGTLLGVFTILVLSKPEAFVLYGENTPIE